MSLFNIGGMMSQDNQIKQIPVELFIPYRNHKFTMYDGERRLDMAESIRQNGVLIPMVVRPFEDENGQTLYEILAGHNRWQGSKDAQKETCPALVKENLTDEEAEMYMIESNLIQRGFDDLRISERAAVVALRHSQMFTESKRQEIQEELETLHDNAEIKTDKSKLELVGGEYNLSKNTIARLIRIDKLIPELKPFIDSEKLSIRAAVNLSYLSEKEQELLPNAIDTYGVDIKKSELLRTASLTQSLDNSVITQILSDKNSDDNPKEKKPKPITIKFPQDKLSRYFEENVSADEVADTIEKALEVYFMDKLLGIEEGEVAF